jgi:hypothetical protein
MVAVESISLRSRVNGKRSQFSRTLTAHRAAFTIREIDFTYVV